MGFAALYPSYEWPLAVVAAARTPYGFGTCHFCGGGV